MPKRIDFTKEQEEVDCKNWKEVCLNKINNFMEKLNESGK
jgi:hypothetical protein